VSAPAVILVGEGLAPPYLLLKLLDLHKDDFLLQENVLSVE